MQFAKQFFQLENFRIWYWEISENIIRVSELKKKEQNIFVIWI